MTPVKISGKTGVVGIVGHPVAHTLSPEMHNAAFSALDLELLYLPFDVPPDRLPAAVRGLAALGARGFNVTIPHKEAVVPLLGELSEGAKRMGAVNTVEIRAEGLVGHNTDGPGFLRALREDGGMEPLQRRVLIVGAGGSARAVAVELALCGVKEIRIANRTPQRGRALCETLQREFPGLSVRFVPTAATSSAEQWRQALENIDLLVNATPVGLEGTEAATPCPAEMISSGLFVADLVYRPLDTPLLEAARSRHARTLSGLSMLLYQGAIAFEIWTGRGAPLAVMRQALTSAIRR